MIVFVRRSSAILLACVFLLHLVWLLSAGAAADQTTAAPGCILLDAGHGAPDGGCVSADGTQEAALNLSICLQLKGALEKRGYTVLLTRTDENGIQESGESIGEKKRADMRKRRQLRDESGADLFVSIHMNSFPEPRYHGAQVIYDTKHAGAQQAAICIQNTLREKTDPENKRVPMAAPASLYILKAPALPSLIVECGFLSNPEECAKLKMAAYQQRIADAIAEGIALYDEKRTAGESVQGETAQLQR